MSDNESATARLDPAAPSAMDRADAVAHRHRPCAECPWQRQAPRGKFSPEQFERMRATVEQPPGTLGPIFACHMVPETAEGRSVACAGALAVCGRDSHTVRLAVALGRLPEEVLDAGADWPPLYDSFDAMVDANANVDTGPRSPVTTDG